MRRIVSVFTLSAALLGSAFAQAVDLPDYNAYYDTATTPTALSPATRVAMSSLGAVTSIDANRGVPSFFWAAPPKAPVQAGLPVERVALLYLEQLAPLYGLSDA